MHSRTTIRARVLGRAGVLGGVALLVLAACGSSEPDEVVSTSPSSDQPANPQSTGTTDTQAPAASAGEPFAVEQIASSPRNVTHSGISAWQNQVVAEDLPAPMIDLDQIRSGGPPPDGIPPVDEPAVPEPRRCRLPRRQRTRAGARDRRRRPRLPRADPDLARDRQRHRRRHPGRRDLLPALQLGARLRPPGDGRRCGHGRRLRHLGAAAATRRW